jgi:hypothetical protein
MVQTLIPCSQPLDPGVSLMKRIVLAAAISAGLMLAACASAPAYSPAQSASGMGYTDQRIENDRFRVTFRGAPRMSSGDVHDYALMRAAQVTIENGGDWFEVVTADTDADAKRRYSIESDYDTRFVVHRSCNITGCTSRLVPVTVRTEYETVEMRTIYEHAMEIRIGTGAKLAGAPKIYDARDTFSTISARLG